MPYVIRKASRADVSAVCELVKELATYEKMSDDVKFTPEIFAESVFEKNYTEIFNYTLFRGYLFCTMTC